MVYQDKQIINMFFSGSNVDQIANKIKENQKITKKEAKEQVQRVLYNYYMKSGME